LKPGVPFHIAQDLFQAEPNDQFSEDVPQNGISVPPGIESNLGVWRIRSRLWPTAKFAEPPFEQTDLLGISRRER
jgi:hypothetical protein